MPTIKAFFGSRAVLLLIILVIIEILIFALLVFGYFDKYFGKINLKSEKYLHPIGLQDPKNIEELNKVGANWAAISIDWEDMEPGLEKYDFTKLDQKISGLKRAPILLTVLAKHSRLTICGDEKTDSSCPPRKIEEYENFIKVLFDHLKDQVQFVQIEKNLDKISWQGSEDQYLELLKTAYNVKGSKIIAVANIDLADSANKEKLLASQNYDLIIVKSAENSQDTQDKINTFNTSLKNKNIVQPIWAVLDFSLTQTEDSQLMQKETIKKTMILLNTGVEKVFLYHATAPNLKNIFNMLAKTTSIKRIDFGNNIWAYQINSKTSKKPNYIMWANGTAEINFSVLDPAYYDITDFELKKIKINSKKTTVNSNGLVMQAI
ncbi:MAG: hypothetical protein CEN91_461 [Candidatus Berkelbacteria bacterium Licking1014_85]|uniref:Glycoside hydrolase family 42 N-terminal domain-containing protein n=1 Tax=Candidatus Berkelbacteria bacterium Licking1014_85 TaxID=2017148 RepID=A0A554LHQ5_9BACT|nr:MAG: hypothetical protein CEN91_461 [Candidatus Berkelbacteria bacterium Licking1014_85]